MGLLLKRLPAQRWAVLIADREFIGQECFGFLRDREIKRCIRIWENTLIDDFPARAAFQDLKPGEVRSVFERVLVASDLSLWETLTTYRKR